MGQFFNAVLQLLSMEKLKIALIIFIVLSLGLSGFLWYTIDASKKAARSYEETLSEKQTEFQSAQAEITTLQSQLSDTQSLLEEMTMENEDLADDLRDQKRINNSFEDQISEIGSTVGTLDKLSKTDKELLQKYSKVYFLNENYMPSRLSQLDKQYLYNESIPKFIHTDVEPLLTKMIDDALDDGVKLWIISAFRSFDEQADLKGNYTVSYGSGANTFSADQGYSEHQLGTTVDFTTEGLSGGLNGFETTPAYTWLEKNAYKYGFVLSYSHDNTFYVFEPWHWRFVGTKLATYLHRNNKTFYDLDQRTLDTYLISIFD